MLCREREDAVNIKGYFEETVPQYPPSTFRSRFKVSRGTFEMLAQELSMHDPFLSKSPSGRPSIPIDKCLAAFLWVLATNERRVHVAERFDMSISSLHNIIDQIMDITVNHLQAKFIRWPDAGERAAIAQSFATKNNFPGIIGAIDGSHIPIIAPNEYPENFINRKSFHSIVLQVVCDERMIFRDIVVGWPGSVHDARVLLTSSLYATADEKCTPDFHLLGDSAYPLKTWLLTPYKDFGNMTADQHRYNYLHSSSRMVVERAFGALKGRFPILKMVRWHNIDSICRLIITACVFHVVCLLNDEDVEGFLTQEDDVNDCQNVLPNDTEGKDKRKHITEYLRQF